MFMGESSWVFPVEQALPGERLALVPPLLVSTGCSVKPGFATAGEALLVRQKDPTTVALFETHHAIVTPRLA